MDTTEELTGSEEELQSSREEQVEEEYVQDDLGAHEIEIETIEPETSTVTEELIIPDNITKVTKTSVPPLRPLTIAPKPAKAIPIQLNQLKPAAGTTQLLLLQSGTVSQPIKILSQTGQELNISNMQMAKPLTIKQPVKTITTSQAGVSVLQPKQIVMKKVISQGQKVGMPKTIEAKPGHVLVVQKGDSSQMKLLQNSSTILTSGTKTLTLQQAQSMGYIPAGTKFVQQTTGNKQQTFLVNKSNQKSIKIVPQKSPTKILPAPLTSNTGTTKGPQRILLKPTNSTPILGTSQLIQVSGAQPIGTTGQLHQISIPGKGIQYIKFIQAPQEVSGTAVGTVGTPIKATSSGTGNKVIPITTISSPTKTAGGGIMLSEVKKFSKSNLIAPKPAKIAKATSTQGSGNQVLVVNTGYVSSTPTTSKITIPVRTLKPSITASESPQHAEQANLEANGMRPRKPCNCTKSQCLKLYCDCFANGEFCYMCNCMNCYNNLDNEEHRQRAIKNCLERNPNAFRPKIGKAKDTTGDSAVRKHTKGCNCKRSGCLKNYCECYEAKIACSSNCKCIGCRNVEDTMEKKSVKPLNSLETGTLSPQPIPSPYNLTNDVYHALRPKKATNTKQAFNYITTPVIEASTTCLLALCNNEDIEQDKEECTKQILEEFGRCLEEIIQCSFSNPSKVEA